MAYYLVRARPVETNLEELESRLRQGKIRELRPFGTALDYSLRNARKEEGGWAVWEEEDYCSPPLAQERKAVLDKHFKELSVEEVSQDEGWESIQPLPFLFE